MKSYHTIFSTILMFFAHHANSQQFSVPDIVKDNTTGLVWQRCSVGQIWDGSNCTGTALVYTHQGALQFANSQIGGWRLPNIKELNSLVDRSKYNPAINADFFPNTLPENYWSSTPYTNDGSNAWFISFKNGISYPAPRTSAYYVRLVR